MLLIPCDVCGTRRRLAQLHAWQATRAYCGAGCLRRSEPPGELRREALVSDARRALQGCLSPLAEAIRAACDAHHQARQAEGRRTTGGIAASIALSIASPVSLPNADEYEALRVAASAEVAAHVFALGERLGPFVRAMMGLHHLGVPVVSHLQPLAHAFSVLNVDPSHLPPAQVKEELERLEWMLADLEARLQVT